VAPQTGIPGRALALAAAGGILVYAGLRDENPLQALRGLLTGSPPPVPAGKGVQLSEFGTGEIPSGISGGVHPEIAQAAIKYIGVPYKWGGTSSRGVDCSGLVVLAFRDNGITDVPRTSWGQRAWSKVRVVSAGEAGAGDLVWWPGHIGIVVSSGRMVNSPRTGLTVRYAAIGSREGRAPTYLRYAPRSTGGTGGGGKAIPQ
jgi:cell wall-associated NlpC family hydrolase